VYLVPSGHYEFEAPLPPIPSGNDLP
jgi:hypothetical protein